MIKRRLLRADRMCKRLNLGVMNINVSIVDQQVRGLAQRLKLSVEEELGQSFDEQMLHLISFVVLSAKVMLGINDHDAMSMITEGENEFGVDAIEIGDIERGEFVVTIIQASYDHTDLEGTKAFPQSGVEKAVQAVRALFNPAVRVDLNPRLKTRVEEVRSLILDGHLPRVRVLLCSNGAIWKSPEAQGIIDREGFGHRASFEHVNHDVLLRIQGATKPVKEAIKFTGRTLTEDILYVRVFIGKVAVSEIARIMEAHGDRLLDRNIRRYLGLHGNQVNEAIQQTLLDEGERPNFFFYNNGVTLICERFDFNSLQHDDHIVRVEGLQIINGGQTSKTIQETFAEARQRLFPLRGDDAHVLVRLYQIPKDTGPSVQRITYAINSQNPVDLRDLRSGDERQRALELSIQALGFEYRRQRSDAPMEANTVAIGTAAEAVLAVWRERPHAARFRQVDLFSKFYDEIFTADLNGAQLVIAFLCFRMAERYCKRPPADDPEFVRYAARFIAMLCGRSLLRDLRWSLAELDHRRFAEAFAKIEAESVSYIRSAVEQLTAALKELYGTHEVSAPRLAATFRRGDLLTVLPARN